MRIDLFGNVIVEEPPEDNKPKKPSPFEYIKEFGDKRRTLDGEGYNAWLINTALSMRKDTVFYATEMDKYHHLPNEMQRDFYFHALKKGNYHAKWAKSSKDQAIPIISDYYKCSIRTAKEYLRVLSEEQLQRIIDIEATERGGSKRV